MPKKTIARDVFPVHLKRMGKLNYLFFLKKAGKKNSTKNIDAITARIYGITTPLI